MSTDPIIKKKNTVAGLYGASASTLLFLLVLIYSACTSLESGDDPGIRSSAIMIGFLPLVWAALFIHFLFISFKKVNLLKFSFLLQFIWVAVVSSLLGYIVLHHEGWSVAVQVTGITMFLLNIIIGCGSWACSLATK